MMGKNVSEREINLIDMFWAICLKWRQIILWAVLFACLATGFSCLKNVLSDQEENVIEEISLDDIELDQDSQERIDMYLRYKKIYMNQALYNANAPLMELDANGFYQGVVSYYVDNHFSVEYPLTDKTNNIDAIVEAYKLELKGGDFASGLQNVMECDEAQIAYVKELVDFSNLYGNSDHLADTEGVLTFSVYGKDEQDCTELKEFVKKIIDSKKGVITEKFGEHDIILLEDDCEYIANVKLLEYQQENVEKLFAYSSKIDTIKSRFDENEQKYIEIYENLKKDEIIEKEENVNVPTEMFDKKMVVIGFVGGAVLAVLIIVIGYLFNVRLRLEDDFEDIFGVKLLGNVVLPQKKKKLFGGVDNFFIKMRHLNKRYFMESEAILMVAAGIKIGAKKTNATKIYFTGAVIGEEERTVVERLKNELDKVDIELVIGKSILFDAEALEQVAETGFVVLVERASVSQYKEIADEIEICEHQGVKVLGAVVVA